MPGEFRDYNRPVFRVPPGGSRYFRQYFEDFDGLPMGNATVSPSSRGSATVLQIRNHGNGSGYALVRFNANQGITDPRDVEVSLTLTHGADSETMTIFDGQVGR